MKKCFTLLLLMCFIKSQSQNLGINHFIDLSASNSCYIKAIKYKDLWQITLSKFTKTDVKDTVFTKVVLDADTVLKAILVQTGAIEIGNDSIEKLPNYNSYILEVKKVLENLQLTFKRDVIAGQLEIYRNVSVEKTTKTILPKKEWNQLKYFTPFSIIENAENPMRKVVRRKGMRVYYIDTTFTKDEIIKITSAPKAFYKISDSKLKFSCKVKLRDTIMIKMHKYSDSIQIYFTEKPQNHSKYFYGFLNKNNAFDSVRFEIVDLVAKSSIDSQMSEAPFNIHNNTRFLVYRKRQVFPKNKNIIKVGRKKLYIEKIEPMKTIEIQTADISIEDGFLDNLSIIAKDKDSTLQFTNFYPIPISSKKNIRRLNNTYSYSNLPGGISYKLNIGETFKYFFEVEKGQYDLSPSDTLIKVEFSQNKEIEVLSLKKEDKDKIFEYRIFTDVIGLDEKKPNGLVQIEAKRRIKLYTKYSIQRFPIGGFQYVEPSFRWNKIEDQNSYLIPYSSDTLSIDSVTQSGSTIAQYNAIRKRTVTALDLFQYQQISAGFNLNLISGYNGNTKLKYTIDGLFNFGRTKIRDSVSVVDTSYSPYRVINSSQAPNEIKINTIQWGLDLKIHFFPEARYGFTIGARYINMYLANLDFDQQNKTYTNTFTNDTYFNRGVLGSEIQLHKNFENSSRFYVRYVFNCQVNNLKYNFSQFQIGYNAYLKF